MGLTSVNSARPLGPSFFSSFFPRSSSSSSSLLFLLLSFLLLTLFTPVSLSLVDPPPGRTKVFLTVFINDVSQIDGVNQVFTADFYLSAFWIDNRVNPANQSEEVWNPSLEFPSALDLELSFEDSYLLGVTPSATVLGLPAGSVPAGTWIRYDQRYVATFSSKMPLADFPFDEQVLVFTVESALYTDDTLEFQPVGHLAENMFPDSFAVNEWTLQNGEAVVDDHYYPNYEETYSRMQVRISVARQSQYYVWKIIVGSILLVIMAIFIFVMRPDETERLAATITVFLALITFLFVAGLSVPKVAYQTRLDTFMNFSFFTVFLMCLIHAFFYTVRVSFKRRRDPVPPSRGGSLSVDKVEDMPRIKTMEELAIEEDINEGRSGKRGCIAKFLERHADVDVRHLGGIKRMDIACATIMFLAYTTGVLVIFLANL